LCLFFQVVGYGAIDDVEEAEASEQVEVGGLDADALSALGCAGHFAGELHD